MDISVVIASYNHAPFLEACIQSALEQTHRAAEVIVIDDGSTDGSRKVIETFGRDVRAVFQENRGTYATLNEGISLAKCDWIAIHNSDDIWRAEKLEAQANIVLENPRAGLVHTGVEYIGAGGEALESVEGADLSTFTASPCYDALPIVIKTNPVVISSVLLSRKVWETAGKFDERFLGMGDWEFCVRAAQHTLFGFAAGPLTRVRKHAASAGMDANRLPSDWGASDWQRLLRETMPGAATALFASAKQGYIPRSDAAVSLASLATLQTRDGFVADARRSLQLALRLAPLRWKSYYRLLRTLRA